MLDSEVLDQLAAKFSKIPSPEYSAKEMRDAGFIIPDIYDNEDPTKFYWFLSGSEGIKMSCSENKEDLICDLPDGHVGMHRDRSGEDPVYWWGEDYGLPGDIVVREVLTLEGSVSYTQDPAPVRIENKIDPS